MMRQQFDYRSSIDTVDMESDFCRTYSQRSDISSDFCRTFSQKSDISSDFCRTFSQKSDISSDFCQTFSQASDTDMDVFGGHDDVNGSDDGLGIVRALDHVDIDLDFPDLMDNRWNGDEDQAGEPELYCFEDFVPSEPQEDNYVNLSLSSSAMHDRVSSPASTTDSDSGKKELLRAKTLPVINVTKILPTGTTAGLSAAACLQQPPSSVNQGTARAVPRLRHKFSSPDVMRPLVTSSSADDLRILRQINDTDGSAWSFEDDAASTSSSEVSNDASLRRLSAQLYYTTPPKANMVRGADNEKRLESTGSLYKLARKLSQRDKGKDNSRQQRSVSLDCGDGRTVKIISADEQHGQQRQLENMEVMPSMTASPSAPAVMAKDGQWPSPVLSKESRLARKKGIANEMDGSKSERRKNEKEKKVIYDSHALFESVEQQDLDAVKAILDSNSVDVNSLNAENLSPLDIALMTNNIPMARMLLLQGARESPMFQHAGCRTQKLDMLVAEAEKRVVDLTAVVLNGTSGNVNISPTQLKENERQLNHWEFRQRLLKRMKAGYDHARPPEPPTQVSLNVASNSSLHVTFDEPVNHNGAVVTKYRVEWSSYEDFLPLTGEAIVEDLRHLEYEMRGLTKGCRYYVRVSACNVKGYGGHSQSSPAYAVPSSWRDVDGSVSRLEGKVQSLQVLFDQVKRSRPPEAAEVKDSSNTDSPLQKKRISIKNLFLSAPKFQKTVKRGVHLACLLCCDDRVLVTSEEQLPIIEVDENFSGTSIQSDLYWLMKLASTWEDVKLLRQDMEKTSSAGSTFRTKLLQAIMLLQNSLGMQDLGQFFHRPIRAANGSLLLTLVNHVRDTKFVGLGSAKWVLLSKLARRQSLPSSDIGDAHNMLIASVPEMLLYRDVSGVPLSKGLYLGFLKIQVSVESVRILVPLKTPNCLPYAKIRNCPNVSKEEWEWLQTMDSRSASSSRPELCNAIQKAARKLFTQLGISLETAAGYRLYDVEVVEVSPNVSFLVLLPPAEQVCIAPGGTDQLAERKDCVLLPVQVFETLHMNTYQPHMFSTYARLSSITEMDVVLAQQAQRAAFSSEELIAAKEQLEISCHLQQNLEKLWKGTRWVMDLITFARRDKFVRPPVSASPLLRPQNCSSTASSGSQSDVTASSPQLALQRGIRDNNNSQSSQNDCSSNEISVGKDNRRIAKFFDPNDEPEEQSAETNHGHCDDVYVKESAAATNVTESPDSRNSSERSVSSHPPPPMTSGILRVYAAYDTGLSKGVSVKLHITAHTTARDVINLVVRHLNMARISKGREGPVYSDEDLDNFCLVAVIGSRERVLGDDYPPLRLQNPWLKGRLYVRMTNSVLDAIQQGQATAV